MNTLAFMANFAVDMVSVWWPVLVIIAIFLVAMFGIKDSEVTK